MQRQPLFFVVSVAAVLGLGSTDATLAQAADTGVDPVQRYGGLAEDNPDLVDDRGNGLPVEGPARTEKELGTEGVQTYPDNVGEDHPSLRVDVPDTEPPHSDETDVHGDFGEDNPDLQR